MALLLVKILVWILLSTGIDQLKLDASDSGSKCCRRIGTTLSCHRCSLSELPMSLMDPSITDMDLNNNDIQTIPDGSFDHMTSLKKLNVADNPLKNLSEETFRGLGSVELFKIGCGDIYRDNYPQRYPAAVFHPLTNVTNIILHFLYPDHVERTFTQHLQKVETLSVCLSRGAALGKEFSGLKHLKKLEINCFHVRIGLTENTLAAASFVETLIISSVLSSMSAGALKPFTRLKELRLLFNVPFSLREAFTAIKNMKRSTLTKLFFDGSHNTGEFNALTKDLFDSPNFANITLLSLQNTFLVKIDPTFILKLPRLKNIELGFNLFLSKYERSNNYTHTHSNALFPQTQIEAISLRSSSHLQDGVFRERYYKSSLDVFPEPPNWIHRPKDKNFAKTHWLPENSNATGAWRYLPPSIHFCYLRHLPLRMAEKKYTVRTDNNVLYIDLSYSKFKTNLPLTIGLHKLQGLNLKNCGVSYINNNQLHHLPSLVYVNLQRNTLDVTDLAKTLRGGSKLRWLDLSYNQMTVLPTNLISSLSSLQSVSFRGNPLIRLMLHLQNNKNLETLDFSECSLVNLTDTFMDQVDSLHSHSVNGVTLNLTGNRFECSCSALGMIRWFQTTEVDIINRHFIPCVYNNISTAIVDLDIIKISEECRVATNKLLIILMPLILFCVLLVVVILLHHFQWQVKWYIYKARRSIRLALTRNGEADILLQQVQFDAFIAHDHSDEHWVTNDLYDFLAVNRAFSVCLGQKDFLGGVPITENIAHAIANSRKIVLVVTPAFVKSQWCIFEMHMALVKGMEHIVIILKEEVPVGKMCKTLRMILRIMTYIEYPKEERGLDMFWKKLERAIKN